MATSPFLLSLTQANKLLPTLKGLHKQFNLVPSEPKQMRGYYGGQAQTQTKVTNRVSVTWSATNPYTGDQFVSQMEANKAEVRDRIAFNIQISMDLRSFKEVVFRANIEAGVSEVLAQLELLVEQKKIFDALYKDLLKADSNTVTTNLAAVYETGMQQMNKEATDTSTTFTATQFVYTAEDLVETIGKLTKAIRELEAKRDELNSRTKVTLNFHPRVAKLLGL